MKREHGALANEKLALNSGAPPMNGAFCNGRFSISLMRALTIVAAGVLLGSCASYASLRFAGWDAKVRELCEKDGGVTVYDRVKLTQSEYRRLRDLAGSVTPPKASAHPQSAYVADSKHDQLNDTIPVVSRSETAIVRRSDGKVMSRLIYYSRARHGVIPSFGCNDVGVQVDITGRTFELVEDSK